MKKIISLISILLISTLSFAQTYTVERVIDGDTLKLTNGERVRLIGIDTPESKPNKKAQRDSQRTGKDVETINKMGLEATEFVKGWLDQRKIRYGFVEQEWHKRNERWEGVLVLEFDIEKKDKYGRTLAYLYSPIKSSGGTLLSGNGKEIIENDTGTYIFINALIMGQGYAKPMIIPPNVKYADLFQKLYQEARDNKRGLWK